jgi:hypothetical protein
MTTYLEEGDVGITPKMLKARMKELYMFTGLEPFKSRGLSEPIVLAARRCESNRSPSIT